jgi:hypothetical protein
VIALKRARSISFISKDDRNRTSKPSEREPFEVLAGFRFGEALRVIGPLG